MVLRGSTKVQLTRRNRDWKQSCEGLKVEIFTAMYYRARSEQKPTSPKPPPAAAAKYAPQPPHWVPPGPTGVGGGELVSRPGAGAQCKIPQKPIYSWTFLRVCQWAGSGKRKCCNCKKRMCKNPTNPRDRQIASLDEDCICLDFFFAKLSRKEGFCAHIFYDCNTNWSNIKSDCLFHPSPPPLKITSTLLVLLIITIIIIVIVN